MVRTRAILFASGFAASTAVGACGSRGPLDIEIVEATEADAAIDVDATPSIDASDAAPDAHDAAADAPHEATVADCARCLSQQCGSVLVSCLQSVPCRTTLQCVAQQCIAGGGTPSPTCLIDCAPDPKGIGGVLAIFQCVTQKCGADCTSIVGALGGGGGGGSRRDGGR
jgi:hypothetical protein